MIFAATALRSGSPAGMILPGYGSRTGTAAHGGGVPQVAGTTDRVVEGSKISPWKIGRPSASVAIWFVVSNALKSPVLNASVGVVLPNPGNTPDRNRVQ